jgi:hypothetical protein
VIEVRGKFSWGKDGVEFRKSAYRSKRIVIPLLLNPFPCTSGRGGIVR